MASPKPPPPSSRNRSSAHRRGPSPRPLRGPGPTPDRRAGVTVRAFLPLAEQVEIPADGVPMSRVEGTDLFTWEGDASAVPERYALDWVDKDGNRVSAHDPYCFPPQLADFDLHLFGEGRHWHAYRFLGSHLRDVDGVSRCPVRGMGAQRRPGQRGGGLQPLGRACPSHARARRHPGSGSYSSPGSGPAASTSTRSATAPATVHVKIDPYANAFQSRPETAGLICRPERLCLGGRRPGCARARSRTGSAGPSRSTRCIWAPGSATRTAAS